MITFSFRTLAVAWAGLAGVAAVGASVLQASYVPPPEPIAAPPAVVAAVPAPVPTPQVAAPVPFENRSLLAMLPPPEARPHPAAHPAEPPLHLPVPPIPPMRVARAEPPRRAAPFRAVAPEPVYAADPAEPWGWGGRLPYPGQYAMGRGYYDRARPAYYGWQPEY